jgi:RHS repeat-associated protein
MQKEAQYYPFGLVMSGISSKAAGRVENKRKFNGIEYNTDFDLNISEAFFRTHDTQLGRWWQLDPKPNEFESLYAAMGNNPILKADPLGDTAKFYNEQGVLIGQRADGSKRITPTVVGNDNLNTFSGIYNSGRKHFNNEADYIKAMQGTGITYDTKSISKFYSDNKSKFQANSVGGESLASAVRVKVNGQAVDKNSLKAEATGNTVLNDGIVTVGTNPTKSANSMTGSVQDAGPEPNRSGSIHLHPTHTKMDVSWYDGITIRGVTIYGGSPSPGDHSEHARSVKMGDTNNGVRSIVVDSKYIYLYNSSSNQTITIPRL